MTRAAHILPHDGVGGVETAARDMAAQSAVDRFRLFLIAGPSMRLAETIEPSCYRSSLNPLAWLSTARKVAKFQPDVLVFSLWKSVPTAIIAKLMRPRMRLAYTLNLATSPHLVDRLATLVALHLADEAWSDSAATERSRKPHWIDGRRLSFVRSGLQAPPPSKVRPAFACWSRLHQQKGLDRAIDIIAALRGKGIPATLDLYGPDNGMLAALRAQALDLGVAEAVRFPGSLSSDEIADVAANHSFFLLPSRYEGMAMATVEAMQLGLVPVVTPVGEMADYVVDGVNGLIVAPDRLGDVVSALADLLAQPDRYQAMRAAAIATWDGVPTYARSVEAAVQGLVAR